MIPKDTIEALWQKMKEEEALNQRDPSVKKKRPQIQLDGTINRLPLTAFIKEGESLFLSFHNEDGNTNHHIHDFFEINYVVKGNPVGVINHHELSLSPQSICIMNPNAVHYFKEYREEKDLILNIVLPKDTFFRNVFTPLLQDPYMNSFFIRYQMENQGESSYMFIAQPEPSAILLIEMLVEEYLHQRSYSHVVFDSLITLLFTYLLRGKETNSNLTSPIHTIMNRIYEQYNNLSLEDLAQEFSYHPKYLSSLIRKYSGQSFRELIAQIRLQNAYNLLMYTDWSIEKIADNVGYLESSSFHHSFKKKYNESPGSYRLKHRPQRN